MATDDIFIDVGYFYEQSKNRTYREHTLEMFSQLIRFLQEHELMTRQVLAEEGRLDPASKVRESDLTDEGRAFCAAAMDRYFRANDNPTKPVSIRVLERSLKGLRQAE